MLGSILGLILGIIGAVTNSKEFWNRVADAGRPLSFLGNLLDGSYQLLTVILGLLFDFLVIVNNILLDYTYNSKIITIPFTIDALLLLVAFLIVLAFLESKIYVIISKYIHLVFNKIYNFLYLIFANLHRRIWLFLIYKIGKKVMGGKKLETYNILFYKKLLIATFIFSFIVFFGGIIIFIGQSNLVTFSDAITSILYLISVLFIAGIIAGFPVTYSYMRFLSNFSEYKYIIHRKKDEDQPINNK